MLSRRGLVGALLAAPVIIRTPGLLMPIKPAVTTWTVTRGGVVLRNGAPDGMVITVTAAELNDRYRQLYGYPPLDRIIPGTTSRPGEFRHAVEIH